MDLHGVTVMAPSIVTLTGRSGAGKTTTARRILKTHPNSAELIPSITTRAQRESDLPGEYHYVTEATFDLYLKRDLFLWHTTPHDGPRYGTLAASIHKVVTQGKMGIMILVPDVVPILHKHVREKYPSSMNVGVLSVFLFQTNEDLLRERMRERGDTEEQIVRRMNMEDGWNELGITNDQFRPVRGGDTLEELPRVVEEVLNEVDYPR